MAGGVAALAGVVSLGLEAKHLRDINMSESELAQAFDVLADLLRHEVMNIMRETEAKVRSRGFFGW